MLPKISAALADLVSPISGRQTTVHANQKTQDFKREPSPQDRSKEKRRDAPEQTPQDPPPQLAQVIPFPGATAEPQAPLPSGIAQSLLSILNLFQEQRQTLMRWLGTKSYQNASRNQKKGARLKSGSILDQKIE